ncbi:MAG: type II toxin-antitoxin system VapC family toxin [Actinomycetota bacterium]
MKLLDTNVIVYARGRGHPYKAASTSLLARAERDPAAFGIDVELLQELLDVYTRRGERAYAARLVGEVLAGFPDPFPVTRREIEEASDLVKGYRRLAPRDAIHAAVVITYGLEGIVSAEKSFDQVAGVVRFDPRKLVEG